MRRRRGRRWSRHATCPLPMILIARRSPERNFTPCLNCQLKLEMAISFTPVKDTGVRSRRKKRSRVQCTCATSCWFSVGCVPRGLRRRLLGPIAPSAYSALPMNVRATASPSRKSRSGPCPFSQMWTARYSLYLSSYHERKAVVPVGLRCGLGPNLSTW